MKSISNYLFVGIYLAMVSCSNGKLKSANKDGSFVAKNSTSSTSSTSQEGQQGNSEANPNGTSNRVENGDKNASNTASTNQSDQSSIEPKGALVELSCDLGGQQQFKEGQKAYSLGTHLPPKCSKFSGAYSVDSLKLYQSSPSKEGECGFDIHAKYWVLGEDGKIYPTWHPTVDKETGCKFAHEHGRNPEEYSDFANSGPPPFGIANEAYNAAHPEDPRILSHVGFKIDGRNGFGSGNTTCSAFNTVHHETYTGDAAANTLHEFHYYAKCANGLDVKWKGLSILGIPGFAASRCQGASGTPHQSLVELNPKTPPSGTDSLGPRSIQSFDNCVAKSGKLIDWQLGDRWIFSARTGKENDKLFLESMITEVVDDSGIMLKKDAPQGWIHTVDVCKEAISMPSDICKKIIGGKIKWDDSRSPFKGLKRWTRPMWLFKYKNDTGQSVWYTDALGNNPSTTPFKNSVKQHFSTFPGGTGSSPWAGNDTDPLYVLRPDESAIRLPN